MGQRISPLYEDGSYLKKNPTWHAEDSGQKAEEIRALIEKHGLKPSTIAEVGCGAGEILAQLSGKLATMISFYGYELSPQAFALCRSRERENIHFFSSDMLEEECFYDLLLVVDVLEHVEDYLSFLRKLKTKGRHKIFRIPLNLSVQSVLFKSAPVLRARDSLGHLHYFTKETALATLKDSGYQVIDFFHTYGPFSRIHIGWEKYWLKSIKKLIFSIHKEWVARLLDGFSLIVLAE
jgi:2-polyprenyl-3-methyl-5-hydroxy-6-metoxy-1,4-benzoquinol methylase